MLTLPIETHADVLVVRDHADPARVHVVRALPKLAEASPGRPSLRLLHWTSVDDPGAGERAVGGHLFLEIDMQPTQAELAAAGLSGIDGLAVPWTDASAVLDAPGLDPVSVPVSVVTGGRAAFATGLTPLQVSGLAPLLRPDAITPLQVTWVGSLQVRLPGVEVIATVDVTRVQSSIETWSYTDIRTLVTTDARVEIRGGTNPELDAALREWALDELAERVAAGRDALVRTSAAQVVTWPVRLSSTLTLDAGAQADAMVIAMALDPEELGEPPPLSIEARGFAAAGVERVDVEVRVDDGAAQAVAIASEAPVMVAMPRGSLTWRHRAIAGGVQAPWSEWLSAGPLRALTIPVVSVRAREIEVLAGVLDLEDRWPAVQVTLTTEGTSGSRGSHVVELDRTTRSARWTVPASFAGDAVLWRATLTSRYGVAVKIPQQRVQHDAVVLDDPLGHQKLSRALVPSGAGWDRVALVMVDLRHDDDGEVLEQAIELRRIADFVQIDLPLRDGGSRVVAWRVHASYVDGGYARGPWQSGEGTVIAVTLP